MNTPKIIFTAFVAAVVGGGIILKLTVPLSYAERPIYQEAAAFVASLQLEHPLTAEQAAIRYLFYGSDYQAVVPTRIEITSKTLENQIVRVTIFDPSCEDDSVSSSIDRVYMRKDERDGWKPVKLEFSQKGRGRFGWTTSSTL